MRTLYCLIVYILVISSFTSGLLHAENSDEQINISARVNLNTTGTRIGNGIKLKIILDAALPGSGWDFRVTHDTASPEIPEVFMLYSHGRFSSRFGSIYISGLPAYLGNPFSVNTCNDLFTPISISLTQAPIKAAGDSRKYPEVLLEWDICGERTSCPVKLYAYAVPPGLNDATHYRAGIFGTTTSSNQTIQGGVLWHGIQNGESRLEETAWYPEEMQGRADSRQGFSAGFTMFRETVFAGSGLTALVSLDAFRKSGFMSGGSFYLDNGFLSVRYFQSIYSQSFPIIYPENSSNISALHTGTITLDVSSNMRVAMGLSEEINTTNWDLNGMDQAKRSCETDIKINAGIASIKLRDLLTYSFSADGQGFSVHRNLDSEFMMHFGALKITIGVSPSYSDRQHIKIDKNLKLQIKSEYISFSFGINYSGKIQVSSAELVVEYNTLQLTVKADTSGKYQIAVIAGT
ncbi:MAG: hypothetical protein KAQ69_04565 [Spirochaetales bacterium]|nr:hypothetical protein [Spirochaetales bacterium]